MKTGTSLGSIAATAVIACGIVCVADSRVRAQESPRTLVAIFAHPDDEQVVSPLLARYAREGVDVHLVIATDGQKGVRDHAGIPAGEALATARAAEARCACEKLGIHPPILLGLVDGDLYTTQSKTTLLREVARLFTELKPDVVVTWGPDGITGHTDHRMVSNVVTQVVQRGATDAPRQLFYSGLSAERLAVIAASAGRGVPPGMATVQDRFLPVRIAYEDQDAAAAGTSLACHESQYTPEEMARMSGMARGAEDGTVRLRPWFVDPGRITDLFE